MPEVKTSPYRTGFDYEREFLSLKHHIEDKDFKLWLPARVFNTNAAATEGCYAGSPYWSLPDAATNGVVTQHYVPSYWINGKLGMTVYYTGSASSTNNFNVTMRLTIYSENGTALTNTSGDGTTTYSADLPGPATANELVTAAMPEAQWLAINVSYPYLVARVTRNGTAGTDNNTGEMRLLGVLLQFYPTRR